jgi:hypothetical protein
MTKIVPKNIHPQGTRFLPTEAKVFCEYKKSTHAKWPGQYAIVAKETIHANTVIQRAGGLVLCGLEGIPLDQRYAVLFDEGLYAAPHDYDNLEDFWFINHSCDANMARIGGSVMIAKRKIEPGEELTVDYAPLVATLENWEMHCSCGAGICRNIITGDDWKSNKIANLLWKEWLPHVQRMIIEKGIIGHE